MAKIETDTSVEEAGAGPDPASLDPVLRPDSVAVIGASRRRETIGQQILDNVLGHGFTGPVYPVNPNARSVHSVRAYPSVAELPETPDLAVIVVPKEGVIPVVEECAEAGVGGVVVITAGFREVGGQGVEREEELTRLVRENGMRMVGPNCMGVINASPEVSLNATFAPTMPPRGRIAMMSQSGAMGVTILDYAAEYGIGVSQFVSVGNKPDVSGNDLLEYWREDDDVGVVLMYLENFGNPRRFTRIAREVTRDKPVLAVKAGRSAAGARAASSHTGALTAADVATDALFAQCGVLRVDTVEELFATAMAFGNAPLPDGPNVAVVTNAGGPGIIIADACESRGLEVPSLSGETRERLESRLPEEASVANPVDMIASATADDYRNALEVVLEDPGVDAVIAAFVPPMGIEAEDVSRAIRSVAEGHEKPVMAVLMGREGLPQGMAELREADIPGYIFPESAARALSAMNRYRRWRERPEGEIAEFDVARDRAEDVIAGAVRDGREWLTEMEAFDLLECYGVPVARRGLARSADEAAAAAGEMGYPVVLKAVGPSIVHKTEVGGVELELETADEVREAFDRIVESVRDHEPEAALDGVLVQEMVTGGRETIVGSTEEPSFGPLVMFGLGGIYVEALRDVTFRIQPVTDVDAREMVRDIRGLPLLEGVRGAESVDLDRLAEVIQRVSQLVGEHREIQEMDINPFLAFPEADRCVAVDARVRLDA
ncbi:MAG: acetate--CoA ligase family protein [Candidatus Palauibacterales bacterium]|nr:acetate--CoA ligase family protein [Candidatus Palauibacterales bacterium]